VRRVFLRPPRRYPTKGMWQYMGKGKKLKFLPACTLSQFEKKYCTPTTRKFLLWEAKLELE